MSNDSGLAKAAVSQGTTSLQKYSAMLPQLMQSLQRTGKADLGLVVPGTPITGQDLAEMRAAIDTFYTPMTNEAFLFLCSKIKKMCWSRERLEAAVDYFTDRKWPDWTPGDLFSAPTPKLYTYEQLLSEGLLVAGSGISGYRVPGYDKPLYGYRHEIGESLSPWVDSGAVANPQKATATDPPPKEISILREVLTLRERVEALRRELGEVQRERDLWRLEALRLEAVLGGES